MPSTDYYAVGALDIARPPKEVLIDRLNAIHGLRLNPEHFELSPVIAEVGPNYNAKIWVMPVASHTWASGKPIYYTRMALADLMVHASEVPTSGALTLYSVLEQINSAYGLYLTESDVLPADIAYSDPLDTASAASVYIETRAASVFFTGSITIALNNTVAHGVSTYDEELVHFAAVRKAGMDTVRAFNDLGDPSPNFNYLRNVTTLQSRIDEMMMRPNGSLILLGQFDYTHVNEFGEVGSFSRRTIGLDNTGAVISGSSGNLYGVTYTGLQRIADLAHGRVYAIDHNGEIGGSASALHAFDINGNYDNTFHADVGDLASAAAPYEGNLYVVTKAPADAPVLTRLLPSGAIDVNFPPVAIEAQGMRPGIDSCTVASLLATPAGVCAVIVVHSEPGQQPWEDYTAQQLPLGVAPPVCFVSHEGLVDVAIGQRLALCTSARTGIATAQSLVCATSSGSAVLYSAVMVHPSTGVTAMQVGSVRSDGTLAPPNGSAVPDSTAPLGVVAMYPLSRSEVCVGANCQVSDALGVRTAASISIYDFEGQYASQEVVLPEYTLLACASHFFLDTLT